MATWQNQRFPYTLEFEAAKLNEVRIAVIDGFYTVPHGGVEIGGILFGIREKERIQITDYRKIETEYLMGPSFHLSERDLAGLRSLLAEPAPVGPGGELEIAGWYHSHTRSRIHLCQRDLGIFEEFFPKPWQIAMVLRPENLGPVRAGYFFRDERGNIAAEASADEFTLQPTLGEKAARKEPVARAAGPRKGAATRPAKTPHPAAPAPQPAQLVEARLDDKPIPAPRLYVSEPTRWFGCEPWVIGLAILTLVSAAGSGYWMALHR